MYWAARATRYAHRREKIQNSPAGWKTLRQNLICAIWSGHRPLVNGSRISCRSKISSACCRYSNLSRSWPVPPQRSAVNVNTARAEVFAALFEGLGLANAQTLAEQREQIFFVHTADFVNRARAISGAPLPLNANAQQFDVKTRFLIIHGRIRHGRVQLARDAWVYRDRAARKARIVRVRDAE